MSKANVGGCQLAVQRKGYIDKSGCIACIKATFPAAHPRRSTHGGTPTAAHPRRRTHGGAPTAAHPRRRTHGGAPTAAHPRQRTHGGAPTTAHPRRRTHGGASTAVHPRRRLLVRDSCRVHCTQAVRAVLLRQQIDTAVIPGGLMPIAQPLDVSSETTLVEWLVVVWQAIPS